MRLPLKFILPVVVAGTFIHSCTNRHDDPAPAAVTPPTPAATNDTLFPLNYFPAYPGSYWTYVDSNNDTTTSYTDPTWYQDHYEITFPFSSLFYSDTMYTARFTDSYHNHSPVWGYRANVGSISNAGSDPMHRLVSDSLPVGSSWPIRAYTGNYIDRKIVAVNQTIVIGAVSYFPTIVVEEYYASGPPTYIWLARRYFTKDIGIVREEFYDYTDSTTNTCDLIDYYINQ